MEKVLKHIFGEVRAIPGDVETHRTIEFVISSEKKDRHGTVIPLQNWKLENFNKNGIVGYQHNVYGNWFNAPNPDDVIGIGRAWIEGDQLIGSVKFEPAEINPLSEKIFRKVLHGSLKSTSVGFYELTDGMMVSDNPEDENNPKHYQYGDVELLEFSIVNIPSNTDAVKRDISNEEKEYMKKLLAEIEKDETKKMEVEKVEQEKQKQEAERLAIIDRKMKLHNKTLKL